MKRLILFASIILAVFEAGHAGDFTLRKAIADFVKSKNITVSKSLTKGFDPASGETGPMQWTLIKYEFEGKPKALKPLIEKVTDAYEHDLSGTPAADLFNAYLLHDGSLDADISIRYSGRIEPLDIEDSDNLLLLSGLEREGMNTIIVVQWDEIDEDFSDCEGKIYIIERDPFFAAEIVESVPEYNENLNRLSFYASKYVELSNFQSSTAITEATVMVVEDIIRNGCEVDIIKAKPILDRMIAAPLNPYNIPSELFRERAKNQQTLVNLLRRLNNLPPVVPESQNTFIIDGTIDPELWDVAYKVCTSTGGLEVNPDIVEIIRADGKSFHYDKELSEICVGRLVAILKDGSDCSAGMQFIFVPGEKAILNVHNGHYSLGGSEFYKDYSYASQYSLRGTPQRQLEFARQNINRPGIICALFAENIVTDPGVRRQIYEMLPEDMKENIYGRFLRKYL